MPKHTRGFVGVHSADCRINRIPWSHSPEEERLFNLRTRVIPSKTDVCRVANLDRFQRIPSGEPSHNVHVMSSVSSWHCLNTRGEIWHNEIIVAAQTKFMKPFLEKTLQLALHHP